MRFKLQLLCARGLRGKHRCSTIMALGQKTKPRLAKCIPFMLHCPLVCFVVGGVGSRWCFRSNFNSWHGPSPSHLVSPVDLCVCGIRGSMFSNGHKRSFGVLGVSPRALPRPASLPSPPSPPIAHRRWAVDQWLVPVGLVLAAPALCP